MLYQKLEPRRLLAAGDLVSSFGTGGIVLEVFGEGRRFDTTHSIIYDDGSVLLAGELGELGEPRDEFHSYILAR